MNKSPSGKLGAVQSRLASFQRMALVERFIGGPPPATVGCFCGTSASNANQAAFFDLDAADAADLLAAEDAVLFAAVDASPNIIRSLAINKLTAPLALATPSSEHMGRAEIIASASELRACVSQALAARSPEDPAAPTPPVEKQIFGGFYSNAHKALLDEFQRADWPRRQEIASALADPRLRQLGWRLVAFHAPSLLSPDEQGQYEGCLRGRWSAADAPEIKRLTVEKSKRAIADIRNEAGVDAGLISEIDAYLQCFEI